MSRKTTTVIKLFREGRTLQEINVQLPKTNGIKSILASLDKGVLRGDIKSSDILFTVDKSTRAVVTEIMNNDESIDWDDATVEILQESCQKAGHDIDKHDLDVILRYHPKHFQYGDLYEDMRTIETTLHRYVEQTLKDKFGEEWLECIPKKQKEDMEQWHSDDPNSRCVFEKATLRNLFEIIKCKACDFKDEFGNYLKNHFG